jgi:hypothetical protein
MTNKELELIAEDLLSNDYGYEEILETLQEVYELGKAERD